MHRIIVLLAAILVGAAAPARAWCEASCLAPPHNSPAHCPSHDAAGDPSAISGGITDECPVLDSARPAAPARLDANVVVVAVHTPAVKTSAIHAPTTRPHSATTVFERCTPLRI